MVILPLQQCQITIRSDNVLIILCLFVILLFAITVTILAVTTRPIVLLINLVRCTFHLVLLKRHLKTVFHFILILIRILFVVRILFVSILFIRIFSFVYFWVVVSAFYTNKVRFLLNNHLLYQLTLPKYYLLYGTVQPQYSNNPL